MCTKKGRVVRQQPVFRWTLNLCCPGDIDVWLSCIKDCQRVSSAENWGGVKVCALSVKLWYESVACVGIMCMFFLGIYIFLQGSVIPVFVKWMGEIFLNNMWTLICYCWRIQLSLHFTKSAKGVGWIYKLKLDVKTKN